MTAEKNKFKQNSKIVSWLVFLATLCVVLLSLTSVIFPALLLGDNSEIKYPVEINRFETGIWAYPLLIINVSFLVLGILYFKNKLPKHITKSIQFIFNFEVSKNIAFLVIIILLGFYIILSVDELFMEEPWEDFNRSAKPALEKWRFEDVTKKIDVAVMVHLLGNISLQVFDSYRVIPFFSSVALLVLTYAITAEIAKKRFAGLVAMVIVLQSNNFFTYDSLITYSNFWVTFYVLSLYLIYVKWYVSPISFILSLISKPLTILFIPMSLFFVYRARIPKHRKIKLLISYGIIVLLGLSILIFTDTFQFVVKFDFHQFLNGFTSLNMQFRWDGLIIVFILPLIIGLWISSRRGNLQADSIMILIMGMLLLAAVLPGFTTFNQQPYRFVPLIIFFAMGVGTILSRNYSFNEKRVMRKE